MQCSGETSALNAAAVMVFSTGCIKQSLKQRHVKKLLNLNFQIKCSNLVQRNK